MDFEVLPEVDHWPESAGFAAFFGGALGEGGGFGFVGEVGDRVAFAGHAGAEGWVDDGGAGDRVPSCCRRGGGPGGTCEQNGNGGSAGCQRQRDAFWCVSADSRGMLSPHRDVSI